MTFAQEKLQERKYTTIFSIDDAYAQHTISSIDELASYLVKAKSSQRRYLSKQAAELQSACEVAGNEEVDLEERESDVRHELARMQEDGTLTQTTLDTAAKCLLPPNLSTAHKLSTALTGKKDAIVAFSFGTWQSNRDRVLGSASANERVLILVDDVNENEKEIDSNGEKVLVDLFTSNAPSAQYVDAVMVTASCGIDTELEESHKLYKRVIESAKARGVPHLTKKVYVLAKDRLAHDQLAEEFVVHLDRIEGSKLSLQLTQITEEILTKGVKESLEWLAQIPLMEFHNSVFLTTKNEGAAEIDTLVRLAAIKQRTKLEEKLRSDARLQDCIEAMRNFSKTSFAGRLAPSTETELSALRKAEFERPEGHINSLRVPLACGDVFNISLVKSDGSAEDLTAILLANPCDLVVRENGKRKLNTGLLVPITRAPKSANTAAAKNGDGALFYMLNTGVHDSDISYLFNNSKVEAIPLSILDLCWTNSAGEATLIASSLQDSIARLLPSQQERVKLLCDRANQDQFTRAELWDMELPITNEEKEVENIGGITPLQRSISYKIKREWRLAPEYAAAALSALSQTLARPVFGHDFLKQ